MIKSAIITLLASWLSGIRRIKTMGKGLAGSQTTCDTLEENLYKTWNIEMLHGKSSL